MSARTWSIAENGKRAIRDDGIELQAGVHGINVKLPKLAPPPFLIPWWVLKILREAQKAEEEKA